ncbi:MAG: WD40 repeat domain-containing protein, partial [Dolichospermum sp.]
LKGHFNSVNSVAYSPDGQILASGSVDYTIKLYNVKTEKILKTLECHYECVYSSVLTCVE